MKRRSFLKSALVSTSAVLAGAPLVQAKLPKLRITRIRYYLSPNPRPTFNQSTNIVRVETDQGITGIGEGGSKDSIEQCAGMLIGENPSRIEHLWQMMYRGYFYPPGREKLHALGALDMALWDIKGKALGVPVYELLGGLTREHIECYSTGFPRQESLRETARACIEAGFRAFRTSVAGPSRDAPFNSHQMVQRTYQNCLEIREGVGKDGDWAIDYHTRLDLPDAVRLSTLIEDLEPYFVEDLIRSENPGIYRTLRQQVKVPIAVGEQFGDRWDINELIEQHLIDYSRVTLPNVGGITEFMKLAALCETHYVGLVPHFTGPVSTAALAHVCGAFSGPVLMEMRRAGPGEEPHLPQHFDFRNGKVWPNTRPGLGIEFRPSRAQLLVEVIERARPIRIFRRPDGSITNW
ncbi:MAG: mandelate racemase/muconate lactonizing enzyme family protein [Acidobacteriota bacterium]